MILGKEVDPCIVANDMDRTLLNTECATDRMIEVATSVARVTASHIQDIKNKTEEAGGSFDIMGSLRTLGVHEYDMAKIHKTYASLKDGSDMLYDDALPYLDALDKYGVANFIMTYGSHEWQRAKLDATGLSDRPFLITDKVSKGSHIQTCWQDSDHQYVIPFTSGDVALSRRVVLVDDKAGSFEGMPANCTGYLLRRPGERVLRSQGSVVPERVKIIQDLAAITLKRPLETH